MNQDLSLTRNRVRKRLVPVLREFNPAVDEAIARAAAMVRVELAHVDETAEEIAVGGELAVSVLTALAPSVATRVLRRWLTAHEVEVSADTLARVWSVAEGESPRQDLNGGKVVVRRNALLAIE
jgi:hypothetical protein